VTEIAKRLDLPPPTVHGLLRTLVAHGFVEQDRTAEKYQLGPGLLHLGSSYLDVNELRARSVGWADRLALHADAAVRGGVLVSGVVLVVHHAFRPDHDVHIAEVGARLPVHASALGKAMLAFAAPEAVDDLVTESLPRLTGRTLDARGLRAELAEVERSGVAHERGDAVLGESSVAAPIFDADSATVGAIGVVADSSRLLPRGRAPGALVTAVVTAARGVSRELGAPDWPVRPVA
jgi:DNA-binding IclR family transcriptional regulator